MAEYPMARWDEWARWPLIMVEETGQQFIVFGKIVPRPGFREAPAVEVTGLELKTDHSGNAVAMVPGAEGIYAYVLLEDERPFQRPILSLSIHISVVTEERGA